MKKTEPPKIILASHSPRRREILKGLNLDFDVIEPDDVEKPPENDVPVEIFVVEQARLKAFSVYNKLLSTKLRSLIIGCDTVAVLNDEIIGKPKSPADAKRILKKLSGSKHKVISGLCIYELPFGFEQSAYEITELEMLKMSEYEIDDYINSGEAMGKAGAYAIQETGDRFVKVIKGSVENVAGFPVDTFIEIMQRFGVRIQR